MSCQCDLTTFPRAFPDNLVFLLDDDRKNMIPKKKRYLGKKTALVKKPTMNVSVIIESELDQAVFLEFWVTELNYGTELFTIKAPFFGIWHDWTVSVIGDMEERPSKGWSDIKLGLKIEDDISEVIESMQCEEC